MDRHNVLRRTTPSIMGWITMSNWKNWPRDIEMMHDKFGVPDWIDDSTPDKRQRTYEVKNENAHRRILGNYECVSPRRRRGDDRWSY